jgi:hypothetical protein
MPNPKEKPHYVKNADFSEAVVEYVRKTNECIERGEPKPVVPNYVAECFLKIAEGLSHKANFVRYTYREEMVMDAVENCLRAIQNYDLETATRTGKPNAFAYFTQISWYAFLRRIDKEKRQQDIKMKYIVESDMSRLVAEEINNNAAAQATNAFVEELRERIDFVKESDRLFKLYAKEEQRKKRSRQTDSDLTDWL